MALANVSFCVTIDLLIYVDYDDTITFQLWYVYLFVPPSFKCAFLNFKQNVYALCHRRLARWRMWRACDVGKAKEGLENELWRRWSGGNVGEWALSVTLPTSQLIFQPFRHFTYVTAHSTALPLLHLCHRHFTYVTWLSAHYPLMMFNISMMIL